MERRFNLIKSDFEKHEKRKLPSFPFCYLTFKSELTSRVLEVKDISFTGMQLALYEGAEYRPEDIIKGKIHWLGSSLDIIGTVKWRTENRLGLEFARKRDVQEGVAKFLDMEHLVQKIKPLHKVEDGLEIPARLKYWLRSDGPIEVFVWQHNNGEIAKFQVLFMENFVEWEDGLGLQSGRVISKRNADTPLIEEDEWVFNIDPYADSEKVDRVKSLIAHIGEDLLPQEARGFLLRQLS